jgi:hypothetical protein
MLNDIVKGILITAEVLRLARIERQRAEEERRLAAERQAELERLQRAEEARRQDLEQQAARWVKSQNLDAYLRAVEQEALRREVAITRDAPLGRWLAWARQHADRLDPGGGEPAGEAGRRCGGWSGMISNARANSAEQEFT